MTMFGGILRLSRAMATAVVVLAQIGALRGQYALRTVVLSPPPAANEPVGVWSGNALLNIEGHISGQPVLHVYSASGEELQRVAVQASGSGTLQVLNNHFARSTDGYLAVTGFNYGDGDRGATFLNIVKPGGGSQTVVRTEPYLPVAVTFAGDGMIWLAGWEKDENGKDKGPASGYFHLRILDRSGRLLHGVASRMIFPSAAPPVSGTTLASSKDRVAWFVPLGGRYMEFALDGTQLADFPLPVELADLAGTALCVDNSAWVSINSPDGSSILKKLDRAKGIWAGSTKIDPGVYLYGCSGTDLVTSKNGVTAIEWRPTF